MSHGKLLFCHLTNFFLTCVTIILIKYYFRNEKTNEAFNFQKGTDFKFGASSQRASRGVDPNQERFAQERASRHRASRDHKERIERA
jgi:hypothetical protein